MGKIIYVQMSGLLIRGERKIVAFRLAIQWNLKGKELQILEI